MVLKHGTKYWVKRACILGRNEISTFFLSSLGVLIYAIGVSWFTLPYHFPDAGVMGIALLLKYTIGFSPALFNLIANVGLMVWGGRELPKRFLIWTIYNTVLLSFFLELLDVVQIPMIKDMFLVSVAGGLIKGIGIGMMFRCGTSSGGTDIIVAVMRKRFGIEVGRYSFYLNVGILGASYGIVGLEKLLFGFVSGYVEGETMDNVLSSFDKRRLVFIVGTKKNEPEIVSFISNTLGRGSTLLDGHGGYTMDERTTIMCLLTPRQTMELKRYLAQHHSRAFMVITDASEVLGNGFKRWKNI